MATNAKGNTYEITEAGLHCARFESFVRSFALCSFSAAAMLLFVFANMVLVCLMILFFVVCVLYCLFDFVRVCLFFVCFSGRHLFSDTVLKNGRSI